MPAERIWAREDVSIDYTDSRYDVFSDDANNPYLEGKGTQYIRADVVDQMIADAKIEVWKEAGAMMDKHLGGAK